MSGHGRSRGRRRGGHGGGGHEGGDERWLLTYADMITLLMALFMVLFSISSVNISKYQVLQHALVRMPEAIEWEEVLAAKPTPPAADDESQGLVAH